MIDKSYPLYLGNKPKTPNSDLVVKDKYTGEAVCEVPLADDSLIDAGVGLAEDAATEMARLPLYQRQAVLQHCVAQFEERADELARVLCIEAGKPIKDCKGEVGRLIDTFRLACEACPQVGGETMRLDISERNRGYRGMTQQVPVGICSFISPFNFPLNLVAHKIAPAIAAGCPFILKPASRTPIGALTIGEILAETDLPEGAFSILPCDRDAAERFTTDSRIKLLSFTGSDTVGWKLKEKAGKKRVVLELGGNAACIVDENVDLEDAVERIVFGAFYQSGQSCVSVQRIIAHQSLYSELKEKLTRAAQDLVAGNPKSEDTFIGPLIEESAAERLEKWIEEAVQDGARVLCGGNRKGALHEATVLEDVGADQKLYREEAFGPVALLSSFSRFEEALLEANRSKYGLQAGIFTQNLKHALRAWDELDVGGVIINDVPSWRADNMPYGGVKDSGLGREGVRYAIEEMMDTRLMAVREL